MVTAWMMLDFVGPRERDPPQVSRWMRRPAETWVARREMSGKSISKVCRSGMYELRRRQWNGEWEYVCTVKQSSRNERLIVANVMIFGIDTQTWRLAVMYRNCYCGDDYYFHSRPKTTLGEQYICGSEIPTIIRRSGELGSSLLTSRALSGRSSAQVLKLISSTGHLGKREFLAAVVG